MVDSEALWREALYGPSGFFTRGEVPADHFRTAALVGPELAEALLVLLERVDFALGRPARLDFVDVGAGGGELSAAVRAGASGSLAERLVVTAVDVGPARSWPGVRWTSELPSSVCGLLVGHEWLDAVPCPVVAGPSSHPWLDRWWPVAEGERAEIGEPRDVAWADAVSRVRGAALAVDYGHVRADRVAGRYAAGTFAAYRGGRRVEPVFDGSCDLTAHVALDACGEAAGGDRVLVSQRDALAALGLVGEVPPVGGAAWLAAAERASRIAELRAEGGLGSFGWLLHGVGVPVSSLLPPLPPWRP
ncbi:SAM-dependent methyltransferase [Actinosynnema sp. NPDC023658]|uniref:SAM-dependent methyltransferase n=1 Tax=Actinosynnema sp. NPDC023658 TaxID=3155465 RepID=UPI0033C31DF7